MSDEWDALRDTIVETLRSTLKDFVADAQVDEFVKEKAAQWAREKWLSQTEKDEAKKAEHLANLGHLAAQVAGEAAALEIKASRTAKALIGKVLEAAAGLLLRLAPKLLGV